MARVTLATNVATGTATLAAGTVTIANPNVTANSIIRASNIKAAGTIGALSITLNPTVGFTINSSSGADTSSVYYEIVSY